MSEEVKPAFHPQFKVGDVVVLRSGGPAMTMELIPVGADMEVYGVCWFSGDVLHRDAFTKEQLLFVARKAR